MDIKRWLKEDKGGFGAFLFIVILGLVFFAVLRKDSPNSDKLTSNEIKEITATKMVVARESSAVATPPDSIAKSEPKPDKTDSALPDNSDSALVVLDTGNAPKVRNEITNITSKPKAKLKTRVKSKPVSRKPSKEEIITDKLRAGMTVAQIAKATGYDKKYIRAIKKRNKKKEGMP